MYVRTYARTHTHTHTHTHTQFKVVPDSKILPENNETIQRKIICNIVYPLSTTFDDKISPIPVLRLVGRLLHSVIGTLTCNPLPPTAQLHSTSLSLSSPTPAPHQKNVLKVFFDGFPSFSPAFSLHVALKHECSMRVR